MSEVWRHCSNCKREIAYGSTYQVCTVSTCNRARTALVFCSVDCWDAHLPTARHRVAYAEERTAPQSAHAESRETSSRPARAGRRRVVPAKRRDPSLPKDPLIVIKNLKAYIRAAGGMNTSDAVAEVLSERVRDLCDRAIEKAREAERKTVLDRDFDP